MEKLTGEARFRALWQRNLVDGADDDSAEIYQRLLAGYNDERRHYHSLEHIEHCLGMFELCRSLVDNPDMLELAIWFHDVILVSGRSDNESLSAELYMDLSSDVHDDAMREGVHDLIMATVHNGSSLDRPDSIYMVDIDLSSFGLPWEEFLRDSLALRRENPHLSDETYHLNQTGFQRSLLARPRFFLSDLFYERFENRARSNLARYFEYLRDEK